MLRAPRLRVSAVKFFWMTLHDKIAAREAGICLYGFAPPKRSTAPDQLAQIAAQQMERLRALDIDGVIVYDIQDEAERTVAAASVSVPADVLARGVRARAPRPSLTLPKIVYRCVAGDTRESFVDWVRPRAPTAQPLGAGRRAEPAARVGLSWTRPTRWSQQHAPELILGGIAIAERHARRHDEHERILRQDGRRLPLLRHPGGLRRDLDASRCSRTTRWRCGDRGDAPLPIVLTFSPCGSEKTLAFMKWLGIAFPRWLENDLRVARRPAGRRRCGCASASSPRSGATRATRASRSASTSRASRSARRRSTRRGAAGAPAAPDDVNLTPAPGRRFRAFAPRSAG